MNKLLFSLKKYFNARVVSFVVISFLLLAPLFTIAQGPPGPGDGGDGEIPEQGVPLEGADILLLAMGVGFLTFKVWQYNSKKRAQAIQ